MSDDVVLEELAELTESFTGADLAGLVRQASLQALRDTLQFESTPESDIDLTVHKRHFKLALQNLRPSVSIEVCINSDILILCTFICIETFSFVSFRTKFNMSCCD